MIEVRDLSIRFSKYKVIDDISFTLKAGEILGVVGESGCGKSITSLALMGLLPKSANIEANKLLIDGQSLLNFNSRQWTRFRGNIASMIFQDPMTALNPCFSVEMQILEVLRQKDPSLKKKKGLSIVQELLEQVGIVNSPQRMKSMPHELSGGMAQRVMIAMSLACRPKLLIADEPTTALDATTQMKILHLLKKLQKELNVAMIFVSHDIRAVQFMADKIQVMYAGEIVESGPCMDVIKSPKHPYTKALINSLPNRKSHRTDNPIETIPGSVPLINSTIIGCKFHSRCSNYIDQCKKKPILRTIEMKRSIRCHVDIK